MSAFVTGSEVRGNNGWGPVLRRYFLSSKAAAIIVDDAVPLWVSVNANQSQQLCLQARADTYPFFDHSEVPQTRPDKNMSNNSGGGGGKSTDAQVYTVLNYTICTSTDMETLEAALADYDSTMWDGLAKDHQEVLI